MNWKNLENKYTSQLNKLKEKDPYEILEVSKEANFDEIKIAYKNKVKQYHPDIADHFMVNYSQEVLKIINEAMAKIKEDKQ